MAASAATGSEPFRPAGNYKLQANDWSSHDLRPLNLRLNRRRVLHRIAATAGGGGMVSVSRVRLESTRPANFWMITANGSKGRIDTQGNIILKAVDEQGNQLDPIVLSDVSHCRGSPLNLISVAMLCEKCTIYHFEKGYYSGKGFTLIKKDVLYLRWLNDVLQTEDIEGFQACEAAHETYRTAPVT